MNPTARWSRDEIINAVRRGKPVVTRDTYGKYRDLKLSTALMILRERQLYPVVIAPHEIVVQLL